MTKTKEATHTRLDLTGWVELTINVGSSEPEKVMLNEAEDGPYTVERSEPFAGQGRATIRNRHNEVVWFYWWF